MILLDTNVPIYASGEGSALREWARRTIAEAVAGDGAAIDAVSLAEICVGDEAPEEVAERLRSWGIVVLDVPAAAAETCAKAYRIYRRRRKAQAGGESPVVPLPDFFIGAHAQIMRCALATVDEGRFRTYFPSVKLLMPQTQ